MGDLVVVSLGMLLWLIGVVEAALLIFTVIIACRVAGESPRGLVHATIPPVDVGARYW